MQVMHGRKDKKDYQEDRYMNKDFKNGVIGLLMFMGIILLLGFVETTIENGKKSSYSSNRSSYSYTKSTSSYTSGSSASKTTSSSSKSGSSSSKTGSSSSTSKVSSSGSTSTTATKSSGSKSTSTKSTKSSSTKSSSKKKYYDSYDDGYDDIYMDGDYDYDRYNKKSADDVMDIIKYLLVQAGVGVKKDDWNTYDSMNELIIHYLQ